MYSIIDGQNNACVVATQIKKASSKKGMNAGKFTGKFFGDFCNVLSFYVHIINPFYFYLQRGGVTALLAIKYDELLVGSGDGTVCIVVDQTTKPSSFKKPTHDGVPKTVSEPTKPCLREVLLLILNNAFYERP